MSRTRLFLVAAPVAAVFTLLLSLAPNAGAHAGTKPWTTSDILALKVVSDPEVSPDGRWTAYVVQGLNQDGSEYQTDVWLVPTSGGEARRLTMAPQVDESPRWSPDGRTLAFLSERPRPGLKPSETPKPGDPGADDGKRQIWLIRPDGGEAWMLSDSKGNVTSYEWSRDGKMIAYLATEPKSEERKKAEKEKDDAWTPSMMYRWNRLWVMDVATRKATQLTSGDFHVSEFSLSPNGTKIAVAAQPTPLIPDQFNSDIYLIPTAGGRPVPLVRQQGSDETPQWSPDGRWVAFISQDGRTTDWYSNTYLCVVPAAGGAARNLTSEFDERVSGLQGGGLLWTRDNASIVFQSNRHTAMNLYRAFVDRRPVEALTKGPEMDTAPSTDDAGDVLVFLREDSEHPREVWRVGMPGGTPEPVTTMHPEAAEFLSFKKELVTWKGAEGQETEGLLIYPTGYRAGARVPLILSVHGGPAGTNSNTCTVASRTYPWPLFAQKGYAILMPNPRGSGGYGAANRASNVRDWGGKDYEDLMKGVDALIERGIADPAHLAVCGWSYGGFMTSTIVTKTDRFRAAVVGAGVVDLMSMAGTCDIPEFNRSYFGGWPWEDAQFYVDHSAVMHAGNVKTPTLVVHGGSDERVPTSQGWEFYTALKKVGVPTDLLILPRQPHGPREPKLLRTVQQWHFDWINKYTLGPAVASAAARPARGPSKPTASAENR